MHGTDIAPQPQGQSPDFSTFFGLVSDIFSTASDPAFRRRDRDFTRRGPLDPELLTTLLLYMIADGNRRGYPLLLDGFWDEARSHSLPLPVEQPISAPAFCTARHKITPDLLNHLLGLVRAKFHEDFESASRWRERRVFAVDGVKINLQRHPDLDLAFGVPNGAHCPQVLTSMLFDVCAKMPVDLQVSSFASCEREHLLAMLPRLESGDLLVLDRGYPSHEVFQALRRAEIDFLVRVPASHSFQAIDVFRDSGGEDYRVLITPPQRSTSDWKPLELRAVKLTNHDGEESLFLTTLRRKDFTLAEIRTLYHMRWEQEEFYKLAKSSYIGQGQFRSQSPSGVIQEIHALALFLAFSRYLAGLAAEVDGRDIAEVGQKAAVLATADNLVRILLQTDQRIAQCVLRELLDRIRRHRYRRRPGRSHPRRSFKPSQRWGPQGRRGA